MALSLRSFVSSTYTLGFFGSNGGAPLKVRRHEQPVRASSDKTAAAVIFLMVASCRGKATPAPCAKQWCAYLLVLRRREKKKPRRTGAFSDQRGVYQRAR